MLDELADSMRRTDELDKKAAGCAAANFELVDEFILRSARNAEVAVHDERYLVSGERFINVSDFFVDTAENGLFKVASFNPLCRPYVFFLDRAERKVRSVLAMRQEA